MNETEVSRSTHDLFRPCFLHVLFRPSCLCAWLDCLRRIVYQIVVSQSNGALAIWRPHPNGGAPVQEVAPWHAHTLRGGIPTEAWISFFRRHGSGSENGDGDGASFVVSGADDALMKGWDLRVGGGACGASPAFVCKEHGAGVTAGQWHPTLEHTFVRYVYACSHIVCIIGK